MLSLLPSRGPWFIASTMLIARSAGSLPGAVFAPGRRGSGAAGAGPEDRRDRGCRIRCSRRRRGSVGGIRSRSNRQPLAAYRPSSVAMRLGEQRCRSTPRRRRAARPPADRSTSCARRAAAGANAAGEKYRRASRSSSSTGAAANRRSSAQSAAASSSTSTAGSVTSTLERFQRLKLGIRVTTPGSNFAALRALGRAGCGRRRRRRDTPTPLPGRRAEAVSGCRKVGASAKPRLQLAISQTYGQTLDSQLEQLRKAG